MMKDRASTHLDHDGRAVRDEDYNTIVRILARARLHIKLHSAWNNLMFSLLAALALIALVESAFRFFVFDGRRTFELAAIMLLPLTTFMFSFFRRIDNLKCAIAVDKLFGTRERLSTAVEIKELGLQTVFGRKVVRDAAGVAPSIDLPSGFSFKPSQRLLSAFAALILINTLLFYLPNAGDVVLAERKALTKQIEVEKKLLRAERDEIAARDDLSEKDKQELMKKIDALLNELSKKTLTKEETVAKIAELEQELKARKPGWGKGSDDVLQRLSRKMSGEQQLKKLADALGARDFKGAAEEAEALSKLERLNKAERQNLASWLEKMSKSISASDRQTSDALSKLAAALGSEQTNSEALAQAAGQLSQALGEAGQRASLEQALSSLSQQLAQSSQSIAEAGQQGQQGQQTASGGQSQTGGPGGSNASKSGSSNQGAGSQGNSGGNQGGGVGGGAIGANTSARQGTSGGANDFGNTRLDRERKTEKYTSVYAPELMDAATRDERLQGSRLQGEETLENVPLPPSREKALIPFDRAYYHYYDTAVESLNKGEVPPGMEAVVKSYFEALSPE